MKYLLINHVPFGRGSAADTFRVGDMWLEDLRAQSKAIHDAGMELIVATPSSTVNLSRENSDMLPSAE